MTSRAGGRAPCIAVFLVGTMLCGPGAQEVAAAEFAFLRGADLSMLPRVEAAGGRFFAHDAPIDPMRLLAASGANAVRLRLWHSPADGRHALAEVLATAARADASGLAVLLDLHYSDTWADPGRQTKPEAWRSCSPDALADSVRAWTRDVLAAFRGRDLAPAAVQIGNEITAGFLWDDGRVGGAFESDASWRRLGSLLRAAAAGAEDAFAPSLPPLRVLHLDAGGDPARCRRFLDRALAEGVPFEAIGLSFYPWWHGGLADLERTVSELTARYGRPVIVVETAYPWTLRWFDATHNAVGLERQLHPGYPATPQGQAAFLKAVFATTRNAGGAGVFTWAPEWITAPGEGSPWENLALFDSTGTALPAWSAFASP